MKKDRKIILVYILFVLLLLEITCQLGIKLITKHWLWETETYCYQKLFERHPWLTVSSRPNSRCSNGKATFSFNSLGLRGKDISLKKAQNEKRVICYGGSSTFCTQVSDEQTWPYYLGVSLGKKSYEVLNAGFPGYSSVEAVIQTALQQFDLAPDICIYYLGWNDIRDSHIKDLKSDYSDFHGPSQISSLRMDGWLFSDRLALAQIIRLFTARLSQKKTKGEVSSLIDERALNIYKHNLRTIITLCKGRGIKVFMIPQVLNYDKLTGDKPYNWAPFIKEKDVKKFMQEYNKAMIDICEEDKVACVESVLNIQWQNDDFIDEGHFSPKGNKKFAEAVAQEVLYHEIK